MRKTAILVLLVLVCLNIPTVHSEEPKHKSIIVPPAENITVAFYIGGSPDVPMDNFSIMFQKIKGLGFRTKNVSDISNMYGLEDVDILILMTQNAYSDDDIYVIKEFVRDGGNLIILPPTNISDDDFSKLLEEFGFEAIGSVRDNVSFYEKETWILLNGSWDTNLSIFNNINRLLFVNATALNYTDSIKIMEEWNIEEEISLDNETNITTVFVYNIIWGNNSTMVEYGKGKYLYGENISLCYVQEYWFGSKVIVLSSSLMFTNDYIASKKYDNLIFLENIIKWLGDQINYLGIHNLTIEPNIKTFNVEKHKSLTVFFNVIATNVTNDSDFGDIIVLVGFEFLGVFINVEQANLTSKSFDDSRRIINCSYKADMYLGNLLNKTKGKAIYVKILVIKRYYGFRWSSSLEIDIIKPPYTPYRFHPILLTTILICVINLVAIFLLLPHFLEARKKARRIEKEIKKG